MLCQFLWHIGGHFQPRISVIKNSAHREWVQLQDLCCGAMPADYGHYLALYCSGSCLPNNNHIESVLPAGISNCGFIYCCDNFVACVLQNELPGFYE